MTKNDYQCDWPEPDIITTFDEEGEETSWQPALTRFGPLTFAELDGANPQTIGSAESQRSSWNDEQYIIRIG